MVADQAQDVSLLAVDQYLRGVKQVAQLLDEEETDLLQRIEQGKVEQTKRCPSMSVLKAAEEARNRLVEGYQPLLIGMAKRYVRRCRALEFLDLVQEGNVGLLQALEKYNGCLCSTSFRSWAFTWVRGMMSLAVWRCEGTIRLPLEKVRAISNMETINTQLLSLLGREPTIKETARAMQMTETEVRDLVVMQAQHVVSLHAFPTEDEDVVLEEIIADPATAMFDNADEALHDLLEDALVLLPERERVVVNLRFGFEDGQARTQREVAYLLGVTASTVAAVDRRAQSRLRKMLCA
jgi:RNA polymerase primary sigma factor